MAATPAPQVVITSYGARWNDPPREEAPALVLDVSNRLWDPAARAVTRDMVRLTGLDPAVRDSVLATPEATGLINRTAADAQALLAAPGRTAPVRLHVYCWYGRHRAVAVAAAVGAALTARGVAVDVLHFHLDRPVIHKDPTVGERCVFCQIIAGTAPATVVREWDNAVAILPLGGVTEGHVLVLPRRHVDNAVTDPHITGQTMARAAELGAELGSDLNLITSVGAAATQTVHHFHVHLVPRAAGDGLPLPWTPQT
ncbi:HIT family protein [Streptomyces sp. HF10]|uniref:HIT family protein n=1 Tax=Streptomyces sp. HF10 TaxID=2692233 RepID=UPI001915A5F5|nr:HIT domain-containing protein [Streptomyces sp. HF10]